MGAWLDYLRSLFAPRPMRLARSLLSHPAYRAEVAASLERTNRLMGLDTPARARTLPGQLMEPRGSSALEKAGPDDIRAKGGGGSAIWDSPLAATDAMGLLAGIFPAGQAPKRGTRELMVAYSTMPRLRAATHTIAKRVASISMDLYAVRARGGGKGGRSSRYRKALEYAQAPNEVARRKVKAALTRAGELEPLEPDYPMYSWMRAGNPMLPGRFAVFIAQVIQDLKGDGYAVKVRNALGTPVRWYPIPPYWVYQTPSVKRPFFRVQYGTWYGDLREQDVMWWRDPDPLNPYGRGVGIGEALGDDLDAEKYATRHQMNWFVHDASPSGMVMVKGAGQPMLDELEQRWNERHLGFNRAHRLHFTSGEVDFKDFSTSFKDQEINQFRQYESDVIQETYGIPPEIQGKLKNSNRSTIDSADFFMAKYVETPRVENWREWWQHEAQEFDDRVVVDYEPFIPADKEFIRSVMKDRPSAYTEDEVRALTGHDPLPDEAQGRQRWPMPASASPAPAGSNRPEPEPEPADGEKPGVDDAS